MNTITLNNIIVSTVCQGYVKWVTIIFVGTIDELSYHHGNLDIARSFLDQEAKICKKSENLLKLLGFLLILLG